VRTVSQEPTYTPYFALTERDRSRLSYVAEITLTGPEASGLPAGVPARVTFPGLTTP
jgi:HlyD family secretion protein